MSTEASTDTTDLGSGITRSARRLADGRQIVYYDAAPGHPRDAVDRRDLDDAPTHTELRHDALRDEWVVVAGHRQARTFLPPSSECPLCPTHDDQLTEIPEEDYEVVVFENRFPSLLTVPGAGDEVALGDGEELFPVRPANGRCEVICFSADSTASLASVPPQRMRTIIEAWADRTAELGARPGIEQVFCFENRGKEIGVTLHHPHGQIYAFPYLPPRTLAMLAQARDHHARTGRLLGRDILDAELRSGKRIVLETEHWVAYVPFAARWPVEVHLAPRRDVPDLPALTDAERTDLATAYLELLRLLDLFFVAPDGAPIALPYIAGWHQAPVREGRELSRLHLEVFSVLRAPGKLKYLAGVESGMAAWISDTTPERIANRLQEVAR